MAQYHWKSLLVVTAWVVTSTAWAQQTATIPQSQIQGTTTNALPSDKAVDAKYHAIRHLSDNVKWTSWVANSPNTAPSITVQFRGTRYVTALAITPGCAATNDTFHAFSRPKTLTINGRDRTVAIQLKDRRSTQRVRIEPALPTDLLTIQVSDQFNGKNSSVCVSELQFEEITLPSHVSRDTFQKIQNWVNALNSPDADQAVQELTAMGPTAIPMLMANLKGENHIQSLQILETIRRVGSPVATEQLAAFAAKHTNSPLTEPTLRALAATKDRRALPVIARILHGKNKEYAINAANALQHFGSAASPVIESALRRPRTPELTLALLGSLYVAGDDNIFRVIRTYLQAGNVNIRVAATLNLKHVDIANSAVTRAIQNQMRDGHPSVRHAVATALMGNVNTPISIPMLAQLLHDPNAWVAREAINAISQSQGTHGAHVLAQYLEQDNAPFGLVVVQALGSMQPRQSSEILLTLLRRGEVRFRQAARTALATQGRDGLQVLLNEALTDPSLHRDALETLTAHMEDALPLLIDVVARQRATIPEFVVAALSTNGSQETLRLLDTLWNSRIHRLAIVRGWANYPSTLVHSRLTRVLSQENNPQILRAAVSACGQANVRQAIPQIHDLLQQNVVANDLVIEVLGALHDETIEPYIIKNFVTSVKTDRLAMLGTCHQLGTVQCSRLLMNAVTDADSEIQREAIELLNTPMIPTANTPNVAGFVH